MTRARILGIAALTHVCSGQTQDEANNDGNIRDNGAKFGVHQGRLRGFHGRISPYCFCK